MNLRAKIGLVGVFTLLWTVSYAQQSNYQRVLVGNKVSIEIPTNWKVLSLEQRKYLGATPNTLDNDSNTSILPGHFASLAVNSIPYPPGAIIRVSIIVTDPLTQSDFKQAVEIDPNGTLSGLRSFFRQEMSVLATQMQKRGMLMIDKENVGIEPIGGMTAISLTYRRAPAPGTGNSPFQVTQYHVPLGSEKALITLSFRESEALIYSHIVQYVKNSIVIKLN